MKRQNPLSSVGIIILCLHILCAVSFAQVEVTVKGVIKSVDLAMKTLVINSYDGKEIQVTIDDKALVKFEKRSIKEDDEVVVKCIKVKETLRSVSFFKKPRG